LAIYIKRVPGADRDEGVEYVVGSLPFGGDRGERTTVGQRVAVVGRELRERLLGLDTPMERTRLLADAAGLFEPVGKMEDLHQRIVALGPGQLGEACALYLQADGGRGEVAAVHHADPTVSEALRPLLRVDALGEVGRSMGEGGPFLARDLADEALAMPKETVQALAGLGLASALVAPLVVGTRRLGAILCMAGGQRRLEARDLLLAVRFAGLASAAIEAARRHETLKGMVSSSETFTSSAFHELLNGLSRLKSLTQISSRALEAGKPEGVARVERNLEAMCRHLDLMAGLIRDMSDALAISTRGIELHRERTNLNTLIADVVGRFQGVVAEQSNCRLCCELPAAQIIGMWDRTRVEQLLTNLLANAVNYSPGGGLITVSLEETSTAGTECGLGQEGAAPARAGRRMAVVTVRDEGIGVPADQHALVFAPFSKASNAKESHQGAGLGLFICRGIAEAHGGRVWLDSQVGKGSAFHFSLPLEEPRAR
jgi:signal transduction histidine kinase